MQLDLVGINHRTAPLVIREKVAVSVERLPGYLELFRSYAPQGVILSTCNRTEIYTLGSEDSAEGKASLAFLEEQAGCSSGDLLQYLYISKDRDAVRHLFRIAGGLESMIIGEYEVLGQISQSLETAEKAGMAELPLRQLFYSAIRAGRRVREETGISKNAVSVSSVAVALAERVTGDLGKCKILIIGAGEAGRLVAEVARKKGASQIVIASRTKKRASVLAAEVCGSPIDLSYLSEELRSAHVVITCAGAPHQLLNKRLVAEAMKNRSEESMLIIDIALPRNVDPEVGQLSNVFLYNIDDINKVSDLNYRQREAKISLAEEVIADEVDRFIGWWQELEVRPVVGALMSKAEEIRLAQLRKTLKKLPPLSDEQCESLEAMTKSIVTRILEDPIKYLKANGNSHELDVVRELFQLDAERLHEN